MSPQSDTAPSSKTATQVKGTLKQPRPFQEASLHLPRSWGCRSCHSPPWSLGPGGQWRWWGMGGGEAGVTSPTCVPNAQVGSTLGGCLRLVACLQGEWGPSSVLGWGWGSRRGVAVWVGRGAQAEGAGAEGPAGAGAGSWADMGAPRCVTRVLCRCPSAPPRGLGHRAGTCLCKLHASSRNI